MAVGHLAWYATVPRETLRVIDGDSLVARLCAVDMAIAGDSVAAPAPATVSYRASVRYGVIEDRRK
jgi:hypothetical protein